MTTRKVGPVLSSTLAACGVFIVANVGLAALALPSRAQSADAPDAACPIDRVAGQVTQLKGTVSLSRGGRSLPVALNTCILFGDKLVAGEHGEVDVETGDGRRRFGGFDSPAVWDVPDPHVTAPRSLLTTLQEAYHAVVDPLRPPVVYGISRSAETCPDDASAAVVAIKPIRQAPVTPQRLGDDIEVLPVAWTSAGPTRVWVRLIRDDGSTQAQEQACLSASTELSIPAHALHQGDRLRLVFSGVAGLAFEYPILIVEPASLPRPEGSVRYAWMVAAWRIAKGGEDIRWDSIARLKASGERSYAAQQILAAILSDQPLVQVAAAQ